MLTISTQAALQAFSSAPRDHLWLFMVHGGESVLTSLSMNEKVTFHNLGNEPKQRPSGEVSVTARRSSGSPRAT